MSTLPAPQVALSRARQAIAAGRHGEARELCRQALKKNRHDLDAIELLGILELDSSAVGRWRNYEKHVGPLLEGLEAT